MTRVETLAHHRGARRLDAVDANRRALLFDRHRDAGDEPTAADRDDDVVDRLGLLEQLEADGPLPSHDRFVIERMHEGQ